MRRFGVEVRLLGKVGRDPFGALVRRMLEEDGGAQGLVEDPESDTSYSVVLSPPGMDRIFLHNPGANATFGPDDIAPETLEGACWFHFGYPPLMERLYRNAGQGLEAVLRKAREAGLAVSLDLAAVDPTSEAGKEDWRTILGRVLPLVDVFVPSWEELCFMIDRPRYAEVLRRAGGGEATAVLSLSRDCGTPGGGGREAGGQKPAPQVRGGGLLLPAPGGGGRPLGYGGGPGPGYDPLGQPAGLSAQLPPGPGPLGHRRGGLHHRRLSGGAAAGLAAGGLPPARRGHRGQLCGGLRRPGGPAPPGRAGKRIRAGLETQDLLRP